MNYRVFFVYNVVGGTLWAVGLTLLGYFLGQWIPSDLMEKYLILIIVMIVITSLLPSAWHLYQERKNSKE
jgi:membrane-associated protein